MTRTYFRTAIDALLALEQGFEIVDKDGIELTYFDIAQDVAEYDVDHNGNYYPTPETAHLLEPQKGDLIHIVKGFCSYYKIVDDVAKGGGKKVTGVWANGEHWDVTSKEPLHDWGIIQRGGKPFPATEVEG